jgi:predicted ATPase
MKKNIKINISDNKQDCKIGYIDFHADDSRFSSSFGENMTLQLSQMKASSGQVSMLIMTNKLKNVEKYKDGLIIFDEPCRGMSMKNQLKIANFIIKLHIKLNCQVIVTTHSLLILKKLADIAQFYDVSKMVDTDFNAFYTEQLGDE